MSLKTVGWGIDLGTTNSAIARLEGNQVVVRKSRWDHDVTPSTVCLLRHGDALEEQIGEGARRLLAKSSRSVARRFKRSMGNQQWTFEFPGTGLRERAADLSARVLREMIHPISRNGRLAAAVITVPAAFDQPQKDDTYRAAQQAGIGHVELLVEPTAAGLAFAHAHGVSEARNWLVYDLGGGTFDAALLRGEHGTFTVIDHEGHGALGGSDLDEAIVRELVLPRLPGHARTQVIAEERQAELEYLAELAKCALTTEGSAPIKVETRSYREEVPITRRELAALEAKLFGRTIGMCRDLLARNNLAPRDVERLILIGGPTLSPSLRAMLTTGWGGDGSRLPVEGLGISLDYSVNPLTSVAAGAAYFAAGLRYEGEEDETDRASVVLVDVSGISSQTSEESILAAGRILPQPGHDVLPGRGWALHLTHLDQSGKRTIRRPSAPLGDGGVFQISLPLEQGGNLFRLEVTDASARAVAATPAEITVLRGVHSGVRALVSSIGVADHSGKAVWLLRKGDALPAVSDPQDKAFFTTRALVPGDNGEALVIPIIEGNEEKAHLNRIVYTLRVNGAQVSRRVREGSLVEIEIRADESHQWTVSAHLPEYDLPVQTERIDVSLKPEELRRAFDDLAHDLRLFEEVREEVPEIAALLQRVGSDGYLESIGEQLSRAEGDSEPLRAARANLEKLQGLVDPYLELRDEAARWRKHREYCDRNVNKAAPIVSETPGLSTAWRHSFAALLQQYREALEQRDESTSERIAYRELPDLFMQNELLRSRVGGDSSGKGNIEQRRTGHLLVGDVQRS